MKTHKSIIDTIIGGYATKCGTKSDNPEFDEANPTCKRCKDSLFERILKTSTQHPEGFTMDLSGNLVQKDTGYCVGIMPAEFTELEQPREQFLGGWTDQETGVFYLDWVRVIEDKGDAVRTARKYKQLAIYDFENREVIYV